MEALDEDRKYASEAIVYISKLYKLEADMKEAGLNPDAIKERREKEAYPVIQDFEKWMHAQVQNGEGHSVHIHPSSETEPISP